MKAYLDNIYKNSTSVLDAIREIPIGRTDLICNAKKCKRRVRVIVTMYGHITGGYCNYHMEHLEEDE